MKNIALFVLTVSVMIFAASAAQSQTVIKCTLPAGAGNGNERLAALLIKSESANTVLKSITFNLNGTSDISDLMIVKVFYSGAEKRLNADKATQLGSKKPVSGNMVFNGEVSLINGENYIWITCDLTASAKEGNRVGASVVSYTLGDGTVVKVPETEGTRTVMLANKLLFSSGDGGSKSYRIPAIVTAADGSLVTATDKRWDNSNDLPEHIDLVTRRSTDRGQTWSSPVIIAGQETTTGYGDPALVVNKKNGEIVCLFASDKGWPGSNAAAPIRINQSISADNGITWSPPADITSQIYSAVSTNPATREWPAAFIASGAALQLRNGRLMAVLAVREPSIKSVSNFVIYSDDNARTWQVSTNRACASGDEAKVVELDNGDVLMSIRHSGHRLFNISHDHGITWGTQVDQNEITDPFCNGDLIRYTALTDGFNKNRLLHSIPFAKSRKNVSVLLSYDEGQTWPLKKTIYEGSSAYSALTILDDGTIGIYYEVGEYETYQMYFARFSLSWLSEGNDVYRRE
jgi:Neuraminidase (sialidase)